MADLVPQVSKLTPKALELISLNYDTLSVSEFQELFRLKEFPTFSDKEIEKYISFYRKQYSVVEKREQQSRQKKEENPLLERAKLLYAAAKQRATKKQVDFKITVDYLVAKLEAGVCEATGIPLKLDNFGLIKGKIHPHTPSLDRIVPYKGYTNSNCQIVCDHFNKMKNDKSMKDTYFMAKSFIKYQRQLRRNNIENSVS